MINNEINYNDALSRSDRLYIILYCITIDIETGSQLGQPRVIKLFYIYNNINYKPYTLLGYL